MPDLFSNVYNPDVLSCLANLSNDEVFTPPSVANQMLDLLPQELFENQNTTFLNPCCKSGVFLREIAKRLIVGLEEKIPDLQERLDNIFHKQLFGIAITELTSLLSRRSVYCSKYASSKYSVSHFDNIDGNVKFKRIEHTWHGNKCIYCGASKNVQNRGESRETYAYEFIHNLNIKDFYNMKFDVIIGNPPYQLNDGGNAASAAPLYHRFVQNSIKLNPKYLSMIIPARWYAGGKGLDAFRKEILNNSHISNLVDIPNSSDCFPGVNIAGGVCYFLWTRNFSGVCNIKNLNNSICISEDNRYLSEFDIFVRSNEAIHIIRKVLSKKEPLLSNTVFSRNYFSLPTTTIGKDKKEINQVKFISSKGTYYINKNKVDDKLKIIDKYKVVITYAMSGGNKPTQEGNYQILSSLMILDPGVVCTETYLLLNYFDELSEAENMVKYASTKFFRFLLLQALSSIHITKDKFCFIPLQNFSKPWTDKRLYSKYGLTEEEIAFIESMIKPMNLAGDDDE